MHIVDVEGVEELGEIIAGRMNLGWPRIAS